MYCTEECRGVDYESHITFCPFAAPLTTHLAAVVKHYADALQIRLASSGNCTVCVLDQDMRHIKKGSVTLIFSDVTPTVSMSDQINAGDHCVLVLDLASGTVSVDSQMDDPNKPSVERHFALGIRHVAGSRDAAETVHIAAQLHLLYKRAQLRVMCIDSYDGFFRRDQNVLHFDLCTILPASHADAMEHISDPEDGPVTTSTSETDSSSPERVMSPTPVDNIPTSGVRSSPVESQSPYRAGDSLLCVCVNLDERKARLLGVYGSIIISY